MAVVKRYADNALDPSVVPAVVIPSALTSARIRSLLGTVEVVNGDSIGSQISFGFMSSNARIRPGAKLFYDAIAGVTSLSLGSVDYPNALVNALDVHLAGSASAVSAVDIANYTKPLWQVLGYAADPGRPIEILATLNAAATGGGTLVLDAPWSLD